MITIVFCPRETYSVPTLGPILGAALRTSRNPCFRFYRSHARLSFSSEWSLSARREQARHNAQCTMHNAEVTLQNPAEHTMCAMYIMYTSQQNQLPAEKNHVQRGTTLLAQNWHNAQCRGEQVTLQNPVHNVRNVHNVLAHTITCSKTNHQI